MGVTQFVRFESPNEVRLCAISAQSSTFLTTCETSAVRGT